MRNPFKPIAISLSPNTFPEDVRLALSLLFSPQNWLTGKGPQSLEARFRKFLGVKFAVSFGSGRVGLYALLKCLGVGPSDEVLLQAFTCVTVPNPILLCGARPVYVDIDGETFNLCSVDLERKITKRSKVVIVQHTFGQPAEMEKILTIAKKHNLFVIEDCAHALGAEYKGQKIGTLGGAAFFSFGRDKVISSVSGGMVVTSDLDLGGKLKAFQKELKLPSHKWCFQNLFHPLAFSLILPIYNFFNLGKIILVFLKTLGFLPPVLRAQERKGQMPTLILTQMPNSLAILAEKQLGRLRIFNQHRRKIAKLYRSLLKNLDIKLPQPLKDTQPIFLRFTIRLKEPEKLLLFAKKRGILLGDWYRNLIDPKGVNLKKVLYQKGSCPVAEKTAPSVVNLPTCPKMTLKEANRVVETVRDFLGENGS